MKPKSIVFEVNRPAKTFASNTYLFLGLVFTGLGVYYFISQANWERPEEYIPLGTSFIIGLFLLLGYQSKWALPNSKPYYSKAEVRINSASNELEYYFESSHTPQVKHILCSLEGVTSFDYRIESKTKTSRGGHVEQDYNQVSALGKMSGTGVYYKDSTTTYTETKTFLILQPLNTEVPFNADVNMNYFVGELNALIQ